MSIREDFYARNDLKKQQDSIEAQIQRLKDELNQVHARMRNAQHIIAEWEGILISDYPDMIGRDHVCVYTIPDNDRDETRFAQAYWNRRAPNEWLCKIGTGRSYNGPYTIHGFDRAWTQEEATKCAKAWLRGKFDFERFGKR